MPVWIYIQHCLHGPVLFASQCLPGLLRLRVKRANPFDAVHHYNLQNCPTEAFDKAATVQKE